MSFLTTVKATGELFDAATDLGADKNLSQDPHLPLEATKFYAGHHFKGRYPIPRPCALRMRFTLCSAAMSLKYILIHFGVAGHESRARPARHQNLHVEHLPGHPGSRELQEGRIQARRLHTVSFAGNGAEGRVIRGGVANSCGRARA
jgi:hypothetical protein